MERAAFSLCKGGPLYGLVRRSHLGQLGFGVVLALVMWLPLLFLSVLEGFASSGEVSVPFAKSISTHVRLLLAIPLFFVAETIIDGRLQRLVNYLIGSRLVPVEQELLIDAAIRRVARLRDSLAVEALLLLGAVLLFAGGEIRADLPSEVSSWHVFGTGASARPTLAWCWYTAVALPVFSFLFLRWSWRFVIWCGFLWSLSKMHLQLAASHPDCAGGLAELGRAQGTFSWLAFTASVVLAGIFVEHYLFAGVSYQTLILPIIVVAALSLLIFLGPLLFFTPLLIKVRQRDRRKYGLLALEYTRSFDARWFRGGEPVADPSLLGSADIQSLADLEQVFMRIKSMRPIPFGRSALAKILAATLVPMVPLLLLAFPIDQIILGVLKHLFGM